MINGENPKRDEAYRDINIRSIITNHIMSKINTYVYRITPQIWPWRYDENARQNKATAHGIDSK